MPRFNPHDFDLQPYVWYDPFELAERALNMQGAWEYREDCFRTDMRMAQAAAHDHMYTIRHQNEKLLEAIANSSIGQQFNQPPQTIIRKGTIFGD